MSILDGVPDASAIQAVLANVGPMIEALKDNAAVTPAQRRVIELMGEGMKPADILGLEREHMDALAHQGFALMQAGDRDQARELLTVLSMLDPMHKPTVYIAGLLAQQTGDLPGAGRAYLSFIALDATEPDGYLRLGECLLASGELAQAEECFDIAGKLVRSGHGKPDRADYADQMHAVVKDRIAAAG